MADITVTAASVLAGAGATRTGDPVSDVYGEAVTAGQVVYRKASGSKLYKAKASLTVAEAACLGVALLGGAAGQPALWQTGGTIAIGGTTAAGTVYVVSAANAGGIAPWSDLAATNFVTVIGVGDGAGNLALAVNPTGIAHA